MSSKSAAPNKPVVLLWCNNIPENEIIETISSMEGGHSTPEKIILCHSSHQSFATRARCSIPLEQYIPDSQNPFSHLLFAHNKHPDTVVVTAQAGQKYPANWLQSLISSHIQYPDEVICASAMVISCGLEQQVLPDHYWYEEQERGITHPALTALNRAGTAYPPFYFNKLKLSTFEDLYDETYNDDLWLKATALKQGIKIRTCLNHLRTENRKQAPHSHTSNQALKSQWEKLKASLQLEAFSPWAICQAEHNTAPVKTPTPIDAVITWVNGDDPTHAEKLNSYLKTQNKAIQKTVNKTRFNDMGEVNLCIQSLLKFTPWIRTIFIVTDNQTPDIFHWIQTTPFKDRVKIIDHKVIFKGYEQYLPTFNTRSIAAMLWNIPNLAEQFIFLNDDYLFTAPMAPEDFFRNGKVVLRGKWHSLTLNTLLHRLKAKIKHSTSGTAVRPKHSTSHLVSAKAAGFRHRYLYTKHNPHAFLRSTWGVFLHEKQGSYGKADFFQAKVSESIQY